MMIALALAIGCNGDKESTDSSTTGTIEDTGPVLVTDVFRQDMISPVDIVWVLDGAWDEVDGLQDAIDPFWEDLLLADPSWQMGVLDACASGNRYALLGKTWTTWPPPNGAFDVGSPVEDARFRETVYSTFELRGTHPNNDDFLRAGASLYVIYVTDREDASNNETISQRDFDTWFETASANSRIAAITTSGKVSYWKERAVNAGVTDVGSLKAAVRTTMLDAIGLDTTFALTEAPLSPPETVEVVYRDHATDYTLETDYTYDEARNTISFKRVIPPPDAFVRIRYETANGGTTTPTGTTSSQ